MRRPRSAFLLAALTVVVMLFLPGLLRPGIYHPPLPKLNDGTLQFYPWRAYWREEVLAGRVPLWNPYLFGGTPFAAETLSAAFYPGTLIFLLPIPLDLAFKLHLVLHLLVAGFFMDRLCRSLGATPAGAALAALAFALNAQFVSFVFGGYLSPLSVAAWAPAVLWTFLGAVDAEQPAPRARSAAACACFVALQLLGGHPEWAYYTALALGVLAAAAGWTNRGRQNGAAWRPLAVAAGILVGGALLAGVQLLPTLEATWWSSRGQAALAGTSRSTGAGLSPWLLPTTLIPKLYGPWSLDVSVDSWMHRALGLRVSWGETIAYVGVVPLTLAAFGWRARTRLVPASAWLVVAALGLLLAMNDLTHLKSVTDRLLPIQGVFRSPARFVFLVSFSLSVLAGLGMTRLEAGAIRLGRRVGWFLAAGIASLLVAALALLMAPRTIADWALAHLPNLERLQPPLAELGLSVAVAATEAARDTGTQLLLAAVWLAGAAGLLAWAGARRSLARSVAWMALAFTAADLSTLAWPFFRSLASPDQIYAADLAQLRPLAGTTARIVVEGDRVFAGGRNVPLLARVRSFDGYDVFLLASYTRVAATLSGPDRERRLGALAVSARVRHDAAAPPGGPPWRLEPIAPRAPYIYWTDRAIAVASEDEAVARLAEILEFDPPAVLVEDQDSARSTPPRPAEPNGTAQLLIQRDEPGRLDLRLTAPRAGWLVVNEFWYPGWRAFVDGAETPIHRVNGAVRGIELPSGVHDVAFRYAPVSVRAGLGASAAGLVLVALGTCRRGRTGATRPPASLHAHTASE